MLQKVKRQPLAVYPAVAMKISLAVQTGAANVSVTASSSALPPRGSGRVVRVRRRAPSSSFVAEGQPARTFVPHPAPVPLHPRVGRHLHLHLLLLLLPVQLRGRREQRSGRASTRSSCANALFQSKSVIARLA